MAGAAPWAPGASSSMTMTVRSTESEAGVAELMRLPLLGSLRHPSMLLNCATLEPTNSLPFTSHSTGPNTVNAMSLSCTTPSTRRETSLISLRPAWSSDVITTARGPDVNVFRGVLLTNIVAVTGAVFNSD